MNRNLQDRTSAATFAAACALLLLAPACSKDAPQTDTTPTPPAQQELKPDDVLLVVDGITIAWKDVQPHVAWLDEFAPEYSLRKKIQKVLPEYTLPVMFARREFADLRRAQFELATTVRAASGNVEELDKNAGERPHRRERISRGDVELPVAAFVFEPTNVGAVSQPIEVPAGWMLAGCADLNQTRVPMEDVCECVQVAFFTHDAKFLREWKLELKTRLKDRVTYVHPDYRLAMPPWLQLP